MTADHLDDVCQRGRVFSERFPGTAVSDEWIRVCRRPAAR